MCGAGDCAGALGCDHHVVDRPPPVVAAGVFVLHDGVGRPDRRSKVERDVFVRFGEIARGAGVGCVKQKDFREAGAVIVADADVADLVVRILGPEAGIEFEFGAAVGDASQRDGGRVRDELEDATVAAVLEGVAVGDQSGAVDAGAAAGEGVAGLPLRAVPGIESLTVQPRNSMGDSVV